MRGGSGSDVQSDISRLLRQRGHEVTSEGRKRNILLPATDNQELLQAFETVLYNLMRRDGVRKALRDWAYDNRSSSNAAALQNIESYINLCRRFGDWSNNTSAANQTRYTATFEWYVSELLRREFSARASGFSIRLKDAAPEDEFDCIALLDAGLVFVECKTGKSDLYEEIAKFVRRDLELDAVYSFFVFDRDYTFIRGPDDTPKVTKKQADELGIQSIIKVTVGSEEFFDIRGYDKGATVWKMRQRFFMACTAFGGFENRIRYMIRYTNEVHNAGVASSGLFSTSWMPFTEEQADNTSSDTANPIEGLRDDPAETAE
jgi:hypothetical protein